MPMPHLSRQACFEPADLGLGCPHKDNAMNLKRRCAHPGMRLLAICMQSLFEGVPRTWRHAQRPRCEALRPPSRQLRAAAATAALVALMRRCPRSSPGCLQAPAPGQQSPGEESCLGNACMHDACMLQEPCSAAKCQFCKMRLSMRCTQDQGSIMKGRLHTRRTGMWLGRSDSAHCSPSA